MDYRIIFVIFVVAVFLLFSIRTQQSIFGFINVKFISGLLMAGAIAGAVISFMALMTDLDPTSFLRRVGYYVGLQELVSYEDSIPPYLVDNLTVRDVQRQDFDGDNFAEWVVFYEYDTRAEISPLKAVVYDNDRGDPPAVYPYPLRTPNDDYLSEGDFTIDRVNVTNQENGPNGEDLPEILIYGYPDMYFGIPVGTRATDLTIFRYVPQPGNVWDAPTNNPPRYATVGRFHGDGGVEYNSANGEVTVSTRGGYERSQLAMRRVYQLVSQESGYYSEASNRTELAQPILETLDFFPEPPSDIYIVSYPESIVLAFYASNCRTNGNDLCRYTTEGWNFRQFWGEGLEFDGADFGLNGLGGLQRLAVSDLTFQTQDSPNSQTAIQREGRISDVTITFQADDQQIQTATLRLEVQNGQWKIIERVNIETARLGD